MPQADFSDLLPYLNGGVNVLVGLVFLALWLTERQERHNFSLGAFHLFLGVTVLIGSVPRYSIYAAAGVTSMAAASLATAFLIEGVWLLQGRPFPLRRTVAIGIAIAALDVAISWAQPDRTAILVTSLISVAFLVVAARLIFAANVFEKLAGVVFGLRAPAIFAFPFLLDRGLEGYGYVMGTLMTLAVGLLLLLASFMRLRGRLEGAMGELMEAYNQLGRLTADLEMRSLEYRDACVRAEAANTAKTEFLGSMSHELRTPLNAVIGFSDLLATKADVLPSADLGYVEHIRSAGQQLLEMVDRTLQFARLDTGERTPFVKPHDLRGVVRDALAQRGCQARSKNIEIKPPAEGDAVIVACDEAFVRQALLHVLDNAIRFTPSGGGITLRYLREDGAAGIAVRDSGPGIALTEIDKVFDPFWRSGSYLTRSSGGGLGLGLPLAKHLVEASGGKIELTSAAGGGTEVCLRFPPDAAVAPAQAVIA
jgi:two-component system cell cycle sensor histidine kinase PleC